jgi:3-hydroxybutyryl-CoA dehydrogenase
MESTIQTVCVCGAGTMGSGIAQVIASAGYKTLLYELNNEVLDKAQTLIFKNLDMLIEKGKLTASLKEEIIQRIYFTNEIKDCVAEVVIEAIVEKPEIKTELFKQLSLINTVETIFASNTSSLSITALANTIKNPTRVAGIHFFNPAPLMKLVEIVRGEKTSDEVMTKLDAFIKSLGKTPVACKDAPGFIVNRVARPFYIESLRLAEEGIPLDAIDGLLESKGFKMGPFKLMDLIGNDINYAVSCSVYEQLNKPERLKPSPIQEEKVKTGELGKKTSKGYYAY